jgi:hypothetical protein
MRHRGVLYRERGFIERLLPAVQAQYHVGELVVAAIQQCEDLPQHDLPRVDRRHDRVGQAVRQGVRGIEGSRARCRSTGARNGSQRVQPPSDPAQRSQNVLAGVGLPTRLSATVTDTLEFPDTEEVTGSSTAHYFRKPVPPWEPKWEPPGARIRWNRPLGPPPRPSAKVTTAVVA